MYVKLFLVNIVAGEHSMLKKNIIDLNNNVREIHDSYLHFFIYLLFLFFVLLAYGNLLRYT